MKSGLRNIKVAYFTEYRSSRSFTGQQRALREQRPPPRWTWPSCTRARRSPPRRHRQQPRRQRACGHFHWHQRLRRSRPWEPPPSSPPQPEHPKCPRRPWTPPHLRWPQQPQRRWNQPKLPQEPPGTPRRPSLQSPLLRAPQRARRPSPRRQRQRRPPRWTLSIDGLVGVR
ncbi:hypothetical protein PMAYCL1PPCAC_07687 [Pristionchus mayeri]|uniref:Uncharacterized protein n=1 Tax=Pristionchus mayeri TaxID=1317129 RepID=A0AAN4ZAE2_9BILA|nr:hypothetical protein PMAYCL1PPCAC_07687 [Pristionchus mayeri]